MFNLIILGVLFLINIIFYFYYSHLVLFYTLCVIGLYKYMNIIFILSLGCYIIFIYWGSFSIISVHMFWLQYYKLVIKCNKCF